MLTEAEATVEGRISDEDASGRATGTHDAETDLDQRAADPLALMLGEDRHRSEQIPARRRLADAGGREGDMPHDARIDHGDQRDLQRARLPQRFDDQMLRLLTERVVQERRDVHAADSGEVSGHLRANDHDLPSGFCT
jgi:hypothetical protein